MIKLLENIYAIEVPFAATGFVVIGRRPKKLEYTYHPFTGTWFTNKKGTPFYKSQILGEVTIESISFDPYELVQCSDSLWRNYTVESPKGKIFVEFDTPQESFRSLLTFNNLFWVHPAKAAFDKGANRDVVDALDNEYPVNPLKLETKLLIIKKI